MTTRDVTFQSASGHPMRAAIALPEGGGKRAGVIVIHEALGLNDDIRRITARIGDLGYAAIAPDLFDPGRAFLLCVYRAFQDLRRGEGDAFAALDACRGYLHQQAGVDPERTGVIGFCMGGGFALLYALRAPMSAAATFYGDVPKSAERLRNVCPVLGGFGGRDRVFGPQGERLEKHLTELKIDHDVKVYPDAGHSFMSQNTSVLATIGSWTPMRVGYNPAAAEDSWKRIDAFFGRHLGGAAA